jgi:hypothetical protein
MFFVLITLNLYSQTKEYVDKNKTIYIRYPADWTLNEEIGKELGTDVIVAFIEPFNKNKSQATFTITVSKIENEDFDKEEFNETEQQFKEYVPEYKRTNFGEIRYANSNAMIREFNYYDKISKKKAYTKQIEIRKNKISYILSFNCQLNKLKEYSELQEGIFNSFEILSYTNKDCRELTIGTFYYNVEDTNSYIESTEQGQTEFNLEENSAIVNEKKWVSNCEYVLTVVESSSKYISVGTRLIIKILEINESGYTYIWDIGHSRGKNSLYLK